MTESTECSLQRRVQGSGRCNYCFDRFYVKGIRVELFDWIGIGGMLVQLKRFVRRIEIDLRVIVEANHFIMVE